MSSQESEEVRLLRELLKWTKFAGMNQVQSVLQTTLDTPEKKLAYQLSDGKNGVREVAEMSKVSSFSRLSVLWKEWRRKGIGDTLIVRGGGERFKRTFDLEDFGIEFPQPSPRSDQPETATPAATTPSTQQSLNSNAVEGS